MKSFRISLIAATVSLLALLLVGCAKEANTEADAEKGEAVEQAAADQNVPVGEPEAGSAAAAAAQPGGSTARQQPRAATGSNARPSTGGASSAGEAASTASGWGDKPATAAQPAAPPAPVTRTYTLPAGATMRVRTTSTLSSKTATSGGTFAASLVEPLEVDGRVIAEKGANVTGRIVTSDPGGRVKGKASLEVEVTGVELVNGQMANVETSSYGQLAESSTKKDAAKVAIGSGIGAAIGAIAGGGKGAAIGAGVGAGAGTGAVLATRGDDAVIPAEALINFTTRTPISIKLQQ